MASVAPSFSATSSAVRFCLCAGRSGGASARQSSATRSVKSAQRTWLSALISAPCFKSALTASGALISAASISGVSPSCARRQRPGPAVGACRMPQGRGAGPTSVFAFGSAPAWMSSSITAGSLTKNSGVLPYCAEWQAGAHVVISLEAVCAAHAAAAAADAPYLLRPCPHRASAARSPSQRSPYVKPSAAPSCRRTWLQCQRRDRAAARRHRRGLVHWKSNRGSIPNLRLRNSPP